MLRHYSLQGRDNVLEWYKPPQSRKLSYNVSAVAHEKSKRREDWRESLRLRCISIVNSTLNAKVKSLQQGQESGRTPAILTIKVYSIYGIQRDTGAIHSIVKSKVVKLTRLRQELRRLNNDSCFRFTCKSFLSLCKTIRK